MKSEFGELEQKLKALNKTAPKDFTEGVIQQIESVSKEMKAESLIRVTIRGLAVAVAACLVMLLGYSYVFEGNIDLDTLSGLSVELKVDLLDIIDYGTYEN